MMLLLHFWCDRCGWEKREAGPLAAYIHFLMFLLLFFFLLFFTLSFFHVYTLVLLFFEVASFAWRGSAVIDDAGGSAGGFVLVLVRNGSACEGKLGRAFQYGSDPLVMAAAVENLLLPIFITTWIRCTYSTIKKRERTSILINNWIAPIQAVARSDR